MGEDASKILHLLPVFCTGHHLLHTTLLSSCHLPKLSRVFNVLKQKHLPIWFCHIKNRDPNSSSNKSVTTFKPWLPSKPWHPPKKCCIGRKQWSHSLLESGSAVTTSAPSASHLHSDTSKKLECLSQRAFHQWDTQEGNRASRSLGKIKQSWVLVTASHPWAGMLMCLLSQHHSANIQKLGLAPEFFSCFWSQWTLMCGQ